MEQKGILWIVAAVGIFLLAVLGGALILYSPSKENNSVVSSLEPRIETQEQTKTQAMIVDTLSTSDKTQTKTDEQTNLAANAIEINPDSDIKSINTNDLTVYTTNTTVIANDTKNLGTSNTEEIPNQQKVDKQTTPITQNSNFAVSTTIDISKKQEPETPQVTQKVETSNTKTVISSKTVKPLTENTKAPSISVIKKTETTTPAKKIVNSFWVQAASYTNKINAEKARDTLLAEEIPGEVFTYSSNDGTTYYRLRVGPYTTKSEAEYWNKRITLVDEFAKTQSYVTNSAIPFSN